MKKEDDKYTKADLIRRALAVAMMAMIVSHAEAATLRSEAAVSQNITVGDLFDGAVSHADYVLAPAPQPGQTMVIHAHDLQRVADTFGIDWQPRTGLEQVSLTSRDESFDRSQLIGLLQAKAGENVDLQLDGTDALAIAPGHAGEVKVEDMQVNAAHETFTARLALPQADGTTRIATVTGRAFAQVQVPVLKTAIPADQMIGAADIAMKPMRLSAVPAGSILDAARIIGMTPRRAAPMGKPLQTADLDAPVMVKKGQLVTLSLKNGPISLTLQGRALMNGSEGDGVRVLNTGSNQIIEGTVTGFQTVTVAPPAQALAIN